MIKSLLLITFIVSFASSYTTQVSSYDLAPLWSSWKQIYQKGYSVFQEESARFSVFMDNYKKIVEFNSKNDGLKLALNKFADLTAEEFEALYTGGDLPEEDSVTDAYTAALNSKVDYSLLQLPSSVDWRKKGAVTPVKNQQDCGSCWAFSATAALEGLYFLTQGKLQTFSEQQIVDCDTEDGGCNGGLARQAYKYTATAGLQTEADYPYTANDEKCKYDASKATKINSGYTDVTPNNAEALKAALVSQPVSVSIEADQGVFQFYNSGVIKASAGCGGSLNHAVLAVGYTTIDGDEAFIVKNSWGTDWGVDGYVHISTEGKANLGKGVCGILGRPVFPTA